MKERITPNPMDVILTAQYLSCRYKETFNEQSTYNRSPRRPNAEHQPTAGQWQLIIKIAGARCKKPKRCSFAYEAVNMLGDNIFFGVDSSVAGSTCRAMLEAMVEACIRARNHGFQKVLFLGDSRRLVLAFIKKKAPEWLDNTRLADLNFLNQTGLICHMFLVMATRVPMNQCC